MGLLEKSLKKAGKDREKTPQPGDKRPVGWLRTSLGERASALADKVNLEEQYARLESLASQAPEPPKPSLRDRARRFLKNIVPATETPIAAGSTEKAPAAERPRMSLRQRAALLVKRFGGGDGGGEGEGGHAGSGATRAGGAGARDRHRDTQLLPEDAADYELPSPVFFPWLSLSDEGTLHSHVSFGEDYGYPAEMAEAAAVPAQEPTQSKSPLAEFADTIGRITENLKNLHVQLDQGNFIRNLEIEQRRPATEPQTIPSPIISHHVPVDSTVSPTGSEAESRAGAQQAVAPKDVFWPRHLPLDLPARDIRINADGTVSVVPGPFQLPYLAEDIAPPESELSHFTRNLKNAELFIAEGELQLTRIIYERLLKQIVDEEARRKIRANLEALDNYRKSHDWGNFMPIPPWMRNPWQDMKPPQISVSEMPVEAKSITINIDKGFFDVARAAFEQQKSAQAELKDAGESRIQEETGATDAAQATQVEEAPQAERRKEGDRRQGLPDTRGEGAEERRSGVDRRAAEENAPPPPLAADGTAAAPEATEAEPPAADGVMEQPQIPQMAPDGTAQPVAGGDADDAGDGKEKEEENKVQEIRGVLELKTPDQEDTPFLTLTYDFTKIPHAYRLAKDNGIFEYAYYKYKPMLVKAHQFIKRKQITRALNYYRVIREQQIPTEFRHMVDRNIKDITEYLQKYLVTRQN